MSTAERSGVGQAYWWLRGSPEQGVYDRQGERSRAFPSETLDSLFSDQGHVMACGSCWRARVKYAVGFTFSTIISRLPVQRFCCCRPLQASHLSGFGAVEWCRPSRSD